MEIFFFETYVVKYDENDGEVRIWRMDLVLKLWPNEVHYFAIFTHSRITLVYYDYFENTTIYQLFLS